MEPLSVYARYDITKYGQYSGNSGREKVRKLHRIKHLIWRANIDHECGHENDGTHQTTTSVNGICSFFKIFTNHAHSPQLTNDYGRPVPFALSAPLFIRHPRYKKGWNIRTNVSTAIPCSLSSSSNLVVQPSYAYHKVADIALT